MKYILTTLSCYSMLTINKACKTKNTAITTTVQVMKDFLRYSSLLASLLAI